MKKPFRTKLPKRLKKNKAVKDLVQSAEVVAAKAEHLRNPHNKALEVPLSNNVPQITNETIAEHREQVLSGARKYIYPLQHSKNRILFITAGLLTTAVLGFLIYCGFGLYRFYQHNTFLYRVTQVVPFPIARVGNNYIEYENYLFELRHYVHYYQNQLNSNFAGDDKAQLIQYRKQALQDVINYAYVKKLAKQNHIGVSNKEINDRIDVVRQENRLGGSDKVFTDVLRDYWGWTLSDFKRSLKQQILIEKVVAQLDTGTFSKANDALTQLKKGADFTDEAKKVSDDPQAKSNGGEYGAAITRSNPNIPPAVTDVLFKLKPNQVSNVINTGDTLEIVKVLQKDGDTITAQHITFKLKDISFFIKPLQQKEPAKAYVKF